jgi:type III pantothenate kinase
MQLALDIGNTRTKIGLFRGTELLEQAIWPSWTLEDVRSYGQQAGVDRVIVANVAAPDEALFDGLTDHFDAVELTHATPLPFRNLYQTPQTLGRDRLAAVAGAQARHAEHSCLVVDCGTCIKYDLLTADGVYHGGNIAPGATMRLRAMHDYTARLPEAPREMPPHFIGKTTLAALQNGALRGAVLEIEGFAALFRARASPLRVVLTGGDAAFFLPHLALGDLVHEPELTLYGLNHILINITH